MGAWLVTIIDIFGDCHMGTLIPIRREYMKYTFNAFTNDGSAFGPVTVTAATWDKMKAAREKGATIIVNKNWRFTGHRRFESIEKLAQVNSKTTRIPKHIVWACYGDSSAPTHGHEKATSGN
jgi:hypothetical protein